METVACRALARDLPVVIGLELPEAEAAVDVVLYDPGNVPERDREMAQNLATALGPRPEGFAVVLSGNLTVAGT